MKDLIQYSIEDKVKWFNKMYKDAKEQFEFLQKSGYEMKVDFNKIRDSLLERVILNLPQDAIKDDWDSSKLEVVTTVNGIEVDSVTFWNNIESQFNIIIKDEAKKMIADRIYNAIGDIEDTLEDVKQKLLEKFNLEADDNE